MALDEEVWRSNLGRGSEIGWPQAVGGAGGGAARRRPSSAATLDRRWPILAFPGSKRTRSGSGSICSARVIHTWPQRGDAGLGKDSSTARAARRQQSSPERGAWAPRVRQGLRHLAQRGQGGLGVLTQGLGRPELQRSDVGGEFGGAQRRRLTGARGGGAAEALWAPRSPG